tara:strand:+ start:6335 stop:6565 length:231 start_codon:yes stop_codon:yes gene_type:complete
MKIKSKYYRIMEGARLNIQYEMFDEMFSKEHGGDYDDFITWIHSKDCSEQFPSKYDHDVFISDFNKWSKNRGLLGE